MKTYPCLSVWVVVVVLAVARVASGSPSSSMKGWELYYRGGDKRAYVLVEGTNRVQSVAEIGAARSLSERELVETLNRLKPGEEILFGLRPPGTNGRLEFTLPPRHVRERIQRVCEHRKLTLTAFHGDSLFSIYLLQNQQMGAGEAARVPLPTLALQPHPLLTERDFRAYRLPGHRIELKAEALSRLPSPPVHGLPFVVVVYGEPAYLGAFWTPISSVSSSVPVIEVSDPTVVRRAYPTDGFARAADPRDAPAVLDALRECRLLKHP